MPTKIKMPCNDGEDYLIVTFQIIDDNVIIESIVNDNGKDIKDDLYIEDLKTVKLCCTDPDVYNCEIVP